MRSGGIELLNIDCMDYMSTVPDKFFDLAIVDPPYGIGRSGKPKSTSSHGGHKGYEDKGWDLVIPQKEYFDELFRVSQNQIIWGANYFSHFMPPASGWILWDKGQRIDQADGELAFSSIKKPLRVYTLNRVALQLEGTIHPTQKPIKLYKWLLKNYAMPLAKQSVRCGQKHGEEYNHLCSVCKEPFRILDTHLGSGSIAIACHDYKFELTACEIDKDYYEAATKRVLNHISQTSLF